jgi:peptidoglycan hydrolase CwlO-like protein
MKSLHYFVLTTALIVITPASYSAPPDYPGANGQPFQALQEQIDDIHVNIDARLAELEAQLQQLEAQVAANSSDIAALQQWQRTQDQMINLLRFDVNRLEQQVMNNAYNIDALQEWNHRLEQMIALLNARADYLQLQITGNDKDIASLIEFDSTLQQWIWALQSQVNILQLQVQNNSGDITALQFQITSINNQISSLQTELASKQNRITGYCGSGYSIRQIYDNGSVSCEYDNVGSMSYSIRSDSTTVPAGDYGSVFASCPSGYTVSGGGFYKGSSVIDVYNSRSSSNGWYVAAHNSGSYSHTLTAYANCVRVQ